MSPEGDFAYYVGSTEHFIHVSETKEIFESRI
jgi:hypothetical protein